MAKVNNGDSATLARQKINDAIDVVDAAQLAWTTFASVITGFSGTPSQTVKELKIGKTVFVSVSISGTSNATSFTFSLNTTPKDTILYCGQSTSNGIKTVGAVKTNSGTPICNVFTTFAEIGFIAAGTKELKITFCYEAQ